MLAQRPRTRAPAPAARVLAGWAILVALAIVWGRILVATHHDLVLKFPPFWSPFGFHPGLLMLPACAFAFALVAYGPEISARVRWPTLLIFVVAGATVWAYLLALVNGTHALTDPLALRRFDYLQTAQGIGSLHNYLAHFVDNIGRYNQDTMGHPPGMVVVEWLLVRFGIATAGWNATLTLLGGAAGCAAALVATGEIAGDAAARAVAPFLVVVPAAMWWSTADAFYCGIAGWAVALVVLATRDDRPRRDIFAIAGGFLFGVTAFMSYGLVLLAIIPITVAWERRTARPLGLAVVGALPVFVAFALAGFSWFAGFFATRHQYWTGVARQRPYTYFLIADVALFAVATGPAIAVALSRLRDRNVWLLVGAALAVVAIADVSGMSKGEVERIWVPFVPWVVVASAAFAGLTAGRTRKWLALQTAVTLVVAVTVWSWW